jgi:tol-pal system protein YbgF
MTPTGRHLSGASQLRREHGQNLGPLPGSGLSRAGMAKERRLTSFAGALPFALLTASLLGLGACTQETGESKLMHLQTGLDKEFPDRGATLVEVAPPQVSTPAVVTPAPAVVAPEPVPAAGAPRAVVVQDDSSLRPTIRIVGTSKARTPGKNADDHIEMTLPDEGPSPGSSGRAPAAVDDATAKQDYDRALALYNNHDLDHALEGFSAYLIRWPDQPGVESALYWSGEAYLAKGEVVEANDEFEKALAGFPQGSKAPDSLLKLGVCQQRLGNQVKAKSYFDRLSHDFPKSDAARRIPGLSTLR